jgi:hypothetical protein
MRGGLQRTLDHAGIGFRRETELFDLGALILDQLARKLLLRMQKLGVDGPVFARHERRDFVFALANHAQRRTLHTARRQPRPHLLPQQRRQIESDQEIERTARLLGIDEIDGQLARTQDRLLHRVLGDLVEHDAAHILALQLALGLEEFVQVPGYGFALAVGIGREIQRFRLLERARNGVNVLLIAFDDLVLHGEVMGRIDGAFLGHEVANVTIGGKDFEILAEVLLDGLHLSG